MLSNLLPGLRELRAPLAAGSLLCASAYLLMADAADRAAPEEWASRPLQDLSSWLGERGWAVVATVGAYLVGSAYVSVRDWLVRSSAAARVTAMTSDEYLFTPKKVGWGLVMAPFSRPSLRRIRDLQDGISEADAVRVAHDVIFSRGHPLLVAQRELFSEYDRLRNEAGFRDAVTFPGLLFVVVAASNVAADLWLEALAVGLAVVVGAVLFVQARALDREANSIYAHTVADGIVSTVTLAQPDRPSPRRRDS